MPLNILNINNMKKRIIWIASIIIVVALSLGFYFRYYFVFGEGVKAGELNYFVHKGFVFKTYEGKLIQSGFRGQSKANSGTSIVQSYEFQFSVENEQLADSLMRCSGQMVELHYKEYLAPIFWRGMSEYIVDDIVAVH